MTRGPCGSIGASLRVVWLVLVAAALGSCRAAAPPPGGHRLVIVGVDGATWNLMSPLMTEGRLPRLASLYRTGSAGALRSMEPMVPASLWTTIVTGKPPAAHGIPSNVARVPGRYVLRPMTADQRRAPALWSIATERGVSVGVSGWAVTFPAEKVNGFLIADSFDPSRWGARGSIHPEGAIGAGEGLEAAAIPEELEAVARLDAGLRRWFEDDLLALSRGLLLYRVYQPRVALFRFRSIDYASHRFWQYFDRDYLEAQASRGAPVPPPDRVRALERAIPGAYELLDAWIGMLLGQLGDETTLLLVSDHGFRGAAVTDYIRVDLDGLLERLGLLEKGAGQRPAWPRTSVFSLPEPGGGRRGLYLNVRGREEKGRIDPGQAAGVLQETIARLNDLRTTEGQPLFRAVRAVEDPPAGLPEIELIENPDIDPVAEIRIGGGKVKVRDLYRRYSDDFGAHDPVGIILAAGNGIAAGHTGWSARLYDVLPTALYLCGLPLGSDLPGRPIEQILERPVPEDHPRVPSYGTVTPGPAPIPMPEAIRADGIRRLREGGHLH